MDDVNDTINPALLKKVEAASKRKKLREEEAGSPQKADDEPTEFYFSGTTEDFKKTYINIDAYGRLLSGAKSLMQYKDSEASKYIFDKAVLPLFKSEFKKDKEDEKESPIYKKWESELDSLCAREPAMDIMRYIWDEKYNWTDSLPSKAGLEKLILAYDWQLYNDWKTNIIEKKKPITSFRNWYDILSDDWDNYLREKTEEAPEEGLPGKAQENPRKAWWTAIALCKRLDEYQTNNKLIIADKLLDIFGFTKFLNKLD